MRLQERLKIDLTTAIKSKNEPLKETLRVVLGELSRQAARELADADVIRILKKLVKAEKEVVERAGNGADSDFIRIIERYLPQALSDGEIEDWIRRHIDWSAFPNKMQAMRPIMAHFGAAADGNRIKTILNRL